MDANDPKRGNDYKYKNDIAKRLIGNGGKAVVYLVDNEQNLQYRIERMHDGKTHIFDKAGIELGGKRVSDILHVAYFGQKDLEEFGKDFGQGLIENKLLSRELVPTKDATKAKKIEILAALQTKEVLLKDFQSAEKLREELAGTLKKLKDQYEKYNLKEKLELITQYDSEEDFIDRSVQAAKEMVTELKKLIARQDKDLFAILGHKAAVEKELIDVEFNSAIAALQAELTSWIEASDPESKSSPVNILINTQQRFQEAFAEKQQEFEEIKRTIADPDINVETFREVERNFTKKTEALSKYSKIEEQLKEVNDLLRELLTGEPNMNLFQEKLGNSMLL
ncbi:MAG: hypothetical protein IPP17_19820 [Bacteroidetes bacterium]|nr:hypothetical protein [Bacteroidota bacterium]